ncbi:MAG: hypothetical protein ACLR78_01585 [Roseburia sp.]
MRWEKNPFYVMDNSFFLKNMEKAETTYNEWVASIKDAVDSKTVTHIQTSERKSAFSYLINAMQPQNEQVRAIWNKIVEDYKKYMRPETTLSRQWITRSLIKHSSFSRKWRMLLRQLLQKSSKWKYSTAVEWTGTSFLMSSIAFLN